MRSRVIPWLLCAATLLPASALCALEGYGTYDLFPGSGPIDSTKWIQPERLRGVKSGALNLVQREWGNRTSDSGIQAVSWGESLAAPGRVTQLKATVRVNAIETTGCAGNPS